MKSLYCFLFLLIFSCFQVKKERSDLADFIPENALVVIKTSNFESFKNAISNNHFFDVISKSKRYKSIATSLERLSYLKPANSNVLICFSKDSSDSLQFSVITNYIDDLIQTDSLPEYSSKSLPHKGKSITESTFKNQVFYSTVIDSTFFASTSKTIITQAFGKKRTPHDFDKVYHTTDDNKTCAVIMTADTSFVKSFAVNNKLPFNRFTEYLAIDTEMSQNEIFVNGITKANDSNYAINIFKHTLPQENRMAFITPSNSDGFMSLTSNDFNQIKTNLAAFKATDSLPDTALFNDITEIGVIYEGKNNAIVLNSIDNIATKDALISEQSIRDKYRTISIYNFSKPDIFSNTFSPFITFNNARFYCNLDDFYVFSNAIEMLQNIIANYQNKTTLSEKDYFQDIKTYLNDESSLMYVVTPPTLNTLLNQNFTESTSYDLKRYHTSALQFIYDNNFAHINGIIKKSKSQAASHAVTEELHIKLGADLLNTPQLVTNHISKEKEIVVQDVNNNLYLISNTGKILWKKQLQGAVIGHIEQMDIYRNGRLQLVFATPHRIYVIDRNGNDVEPFPRRFNDEITQPLSVFDYDKNKKYRLLVTQGKQLLMFDSKGKSINGFTFKYANNPIICQPKHFRVGTKDYIGFKTRDKLYLLDRTGKTRVTPKSSHSYSSEPMYLYQNKFTTTTSSGDLVLVDTNGSVNSRKLSLSNKHYLETSSKSLITHDENQLAIKGKTTELDFGDYSRPKLFYINDKIYVTITDLQAHKIYLFDSQSKLLPNFPVYGNSLIHLDNIDRDKSLEFITKGDHNSILLYQIN